MKTFKSIIEKAKARRETVMSIPLKSMEEQKKEARKIAKVFAIVATICGILLTFIIPPLCAPDENVHFVNIYNMSKGNFFADEYEGRYVRWLPAYYNVYVNTYPISLNGVDNPNHYGYREYFRDTWKGLSEVDETQVPFETAISSTGYLVSASSMAIGTTIGHFVGHDETDYPYNQILFGRIGNIIFYILVTFFAIKRAPHFNKTMMLIALMPMSLFLGASLSYDAIIIPISLYFMAIVMDLCTEPEKKISIQDIIKVFICAGLIAGIKFGAYLPLLLFLLAIPRKKYGGTIRMIACVLGVIAAVGIGYLPTYIQNIRSARLPAVEGSNINPTLQKEWLLSNISAIPELLRNTKELKWTVYWTGFWGHIGWLDTLFPFPVIMLGYLVLIMVGISESFTYNIWARKRWKNAFAVVALVVGVLGVMYGMYTSFTPVGYSNIEGVQGRYFIPLVPALLLSLSNPLFLRIKAVRKNKMDIAMMDVTILWGGFCAVVTVIIVLSRYWFRF